ncbi:NlpC/P60 family protein [Rhizobium sp. RU35A]|uniref:C40 family peptidase n=1 Tax=Rhizobium sp. RU35A TaxID=1907414 RepID=UPI000954F264|nr:NlpC/P60 family protein [Rhizobium sp. RU35A]SIR16298.1 NlpC/P60 family protein [Rhizobium sp. RU35A]
MSWSNRFVGTPFRSHGRSLEGADCWGLACLVYREELRISLPDYLGYTSVDEHAEIAALVDGAKQLPMWVPVHGTAVAFDLAVFRRGRMDSHIGIVVQHGIMLHAAGEDCAKIESYQAGAWRHRLTGVYRHVELVSRATK